ncbi:transglutaminase superfamily protein [Tenacibaculum adriaticum]|uniref:Transglutaminase superfamily protein n=1 Tax=Tenacibaculum adriaticum TaxID=413713 RepID=A0A5S5DRH8_9FLAO|nr:transglutaminase domain-containing protein [Tenacibaculum adriaticum]TYP97988.1 transglutaminase superfamily protein [Tenacibaculum adriaticum]
MKYLLIFFLLISFSISAQNFSVIKEKTDLYSGLLTAEKLAHKIELDFSSEEDKVKAIFCWMTKNIRYDLDEFYNPTRKEISFRYRTNEERDQKLQEIKNKTVAETLSTRKGVCEGYAQTFSKICDLLQIENEVITGYVRTSSNTIGKPQQQPNHAWNTVKINNKWIFIDTTWGAGYENNGKWLRNFNPYYFNISTKKYFKTHFPEKSIWRLRVGRMEKEEFYNQPIYSHLFLKSDVELTAPKSGILSKNKNGKIDIILKNIKPSQQIHVGFLGLPYAQKPEVTSKNGVTSVTITPPTNALQLFLLIDKEVAIEFLIQ